eukprot:gene15627-biopygen2420
MRQALHFRLLEYVKAAFLLITELRKGCCDVSKRSEGVPAPRSVGAQGQSRDHRSLELAVAVRHPTLSEVDLHRRLKSCCLRCGIQRMRACSVDCRPRSSHVEDGIGRHKVHRDRVRDLRDAVYVICALHNSIIYSRQEHPNASTQLAADRSDRTWLWGTQLHRDIVDHEPPRKPLLERLPRQGHDDCAQPTLRREGCCRMRRHMHLFF